MDALIYCRVSTNKQEASLASQERACLAHAKSLGFTVGEIVRETFSGAQL
jgi:DNA invertase Pin-like site-specific DNA recombinase